MLFKKSKIKSCIFLVFFALSMRCIAAEIELSPNYQIPAGKGVVIFTFHADFEYASDLNFSVNWHKRGSPKFKDYFTYGKGLLKRPPDLIEKYDFPYKGRLVVLELDPGEYILDNIQADNSSNLRSSNGKLGTRFEVKEGYVRYLGNWNIKAIKTTENLGVAVLSILLVGSDMRGFSAQLYTSNHAAEMKEKVFVKHAPQLLALFEEKIMRSTLATDEVHNMKQYPSTNFAAVNDIAAVPYIQGRCREMYEDFTKRKQPKAFAIAPDGGCAISAGTSPPVQGDPFEPANRALVVCARKHSDCKLYSVDDNVVWVAK
jgi:hypothetical protein